MGGAFYSDYICCKALKILVFIKCNTREFREPNNLMKVLYIALDRSILEYASLLWSPCTEQGKMKKVNTYLKASYSENEA